MRREEAEQEAAWRNTHDERRTRLEFYAFDASGGLAQDAWDVTMRLRAQPVRAAAPPPEPEPAPAPVPAPESPPAPSPEPAVTPEAEPDVAGLEDPPAQPPTAADAVPEPTAPVDPSPELGRQRLENVRRRMRTTRERMGTARAGMRSAQQGMRAAQERVRDAQRRMRAAQRPRVRWGPRRDAVGHEPGAHGLGLEPPTRLGRLARLVGTAVIAVAVLWVGMVTALAVLSSTTSPVGLLIYAGAVLIGLAAIGLGVVIRRT